MIDGLERHCCINKLRYLQILSWKNIVWLVENTNQGVENTNQDRGKHQPGTAGGIFFLLQSNPSLEKVVRQLGYQL